MKNRSRLLVTVTWVVGVIFIWELIAFLLADVLHDPMAAKKLPFLHDVIIAFFGDWRTMLTSGGITLSRAGIGFLCGGLLGFILALLMSLSGMIERISMPYLLLSQMIPILGLAPIVFSLVRDLDTARIIISAYITFFPVSLNMLSGLKAVDAQSKDLMYSYAAGKITVYRKLMLPSALPAIFAGLKIAAPMAVTASILVDMLSNKDGIGAIMIYSLYGGGNKFWPAVLTGALMGILNYGIIVCAEWIFIPWNRSSVRKTGDSQ